MDARPGWEHPWSPAGLNPLSDALVLTAGTATSGDNVLDAGRWWPRLRLLIMIGPDITQTLWEAGPPCLVRGPRTRQLIEHWPSHVANPSDPAWGRGRSHPRRSADRRSPPTTPAATAGIRINEAARIAIGREWG